MSKVGILWFFFLSNRLQQMWMFWIDAVVLDWLWIPLVVFMTLSTFMASSLSLLWFGVCVLGTKKRLSL